jgi:hypothetical protein
MHRIFFSEILIAVLMKFTYVMGTSYKNLRLFFHKFSFIINTLFHFTKTSELFTLNRDCREDEGENVQGATSSGTVKEIFSEILEEKSSSQFREICEKH